ncbi:hypothetical protein [Hymenobacter frigidus]|uniref:hypothetical protein n=1 Tax=Hymenobacter frigidus TaxID=1524095 RepID=UPI0016634CE1|nr:hypothetical protein [Hymenobacter frigidus]
MEPLPPQQPSLREGPHRPVGQPAKAPSRCVRGRGPLPSSRGFCRRFTVRCRAALRDLHTDETAQLEVLTKAIRTKGYSEDEKNQFYLHFASYLDIAGTAFDLLRTHVPTPLPKEEEQEETAAQFDRVRKFARLNVKDIKGLLGGA